MTDTIGWGDVDVEPRRPRRHRRLAWSVWPVVGVAVAAVALAPVVKRDLAQSSMRWLQHEWALQAGYDDAREVTLSAAAIRVGIGDDATFVQLIRLLDRQERAKLSSIADAVSARHTWAADVARARTAMRAALRAEVTDLTHDISMAQVEEASTTNVFAPSAYSAATAALVERADALVNAGVAAHHIARVGRPAVRLDAGDALMRALNRVTDRPVAAHLVIAETDGYVEWDLRTGVRRVLSERRDDVVGSSMPVVGNALLVQTDTRFKLVPLDGAAPRVLPGSGVYLPDGRGGMWRITRLTAQRLSPTGRPVGPTRKVPADYAAEMIDNTPVAADVLVLTRFVPIGNSGVQAQSSFLWHPDDGRLVPMPTACDNFGSAANVVVSVSCDTTHLTKFDLTTGRTRSFAAPGRGVGFAFGAIVSPDGRRAAVTLVNPDDTERPALALSIVDMVTGQVTVVAHSERVQPLAWAPDSNAVIVTPTPAPNGCCPSNINGLGYWSPGMRGLASIRVPLGDTSPVVAVAR